MRMKALSCVVLAAVLAAGAAACNRDTTAQREKATPLNQGNKPPAAPQPTAPSPVDTSTPDRNAAPKRA
jgi:hypothetical protein